MHFTNTPAFIQLKEFLDATMSSADDKSKVHVLPLPCGSGKSTYLKHLIAETIRKNEEGMIVITDKIERMQEYTDISEMIPLEECEEVQKYKDKIALLTHDNAAEILRMQKKMPVLIMSTQRYFYLKREEILQFLEYYGGKRTKIIFDEKPYFSEIRNITMKTMNDIDSALHIAIDDTANAKEKKWAIEQWEVCRQKIQMAIHEYETTLRNDKKHLIMELWHPSASTAMTEDDKRFFQFIECHRSKLNTYAMEVYKDILAVRQLMEEGAYFIGQQKKTGTYTNTFVVILDYSDKLLDLDASVFVLDATADISPDYDLPYIDMADCSAFKRDLSMLKIQCVNVGSSKNKLTKKKNEKQLICFRNHLQQQDRVPDVVFTYHPLVKYFSSIAETRYFGTIKGLNLYREKTNFVQIGLNRFPDHVYKVMTGYHHLMKMEYEKQKGICILGGTVIDNTMYRYLLEDLEQNIFRGKIRKTDCDEPVRYTLFCNTVEYAPLIEMICERYCPYGASVDIIDTPDEFQELKIMSRNTDSKTNVQKVLQWIHTQPKGTYFKTADICNACGLTSKQLQKTKDSVIIKEKLNSMKTERKGYYLVN